MGRPKGAVSKANRPPAMQTSPEVLRLRLEALGRAFRAQDPDAKAGELRELAREAVGLAETIEWRQSVASERTN
jgi:hypothetical protein